jgi:hypothetical protein
LDFRYYVFSAMNMWTDVFASIGKRTTGTTPGNFLLAGPNWRGTPPSDLKETYRSSTRYAWLLGQTQANGPDDFAAVNAIRAHYEPTPLSFWGKPYSPPTNVPVDRNVDLEITPPNPPPGHSTSRKSVRRSQGACNARSRTRRSSWRREPPK